MQLAWFTWWCHNHLSSIFNIVRLKLFEGTRSSCWNVRHMWWVSITSNVTDFINEILGYRIGSECGCRLRWSTGWDVWGSTLWVVLKPVNVFPRLQLDMWPKTAALSTRILHNYFIFVLGKCVFFHRFCLTTANDLIKCHIHIESHISVVHTFLCTTDMCDSICMPLIIWRSMQPYVLFA